MTIDPGFLDELDRFDPSLDRTTTDARKGEQRSPSVGEGLTFSDYRRYAPGDDTRLIDWRLYARTEEYYVKQFEEERNLTVHVLLDASGSMDYGDGDANKFEFGAKLGLGFAYLTAEENNDFRFAAFGDRHERLDAGRSNRGELLRLIDLLDGTDPSGEASFADALGDYAGTVDSRSLVVVISDFLASPDGVEEGLAALAENDLVCPHLVAPTERDPPAEGDTVFVDPEAGVERRTYFAGRQEATYRDRLDRHVGEIDDRCRGLRAEHPVVDTGTDFFEAFASVWVE
ncbi:MAG: DUF58 domain-containing protein [Haloferacaceae archaeon]